VTDSEQTGSMSVTNAVGTTPLPSELAAVSSERLPALDFVRGAGVLAMLLATLPWLCRPFELFAVHPQPGGPWDRHLLALLLFFVDHKVLPLFAILFGIGAAFQLRPVEGHDVDAIRHRYLRRMGVLFLLGLAHAFLFWWGDLLTVYAFVGLHVIMFLVWGGIVESLSFYSCFLIFYGALAVGAVFAGNWVTPEGAPDLGVPIPKVAPEGPPVSVLSAAEDPAIQWLQYIQANNQVRIYRHGSWVAVLGHRLFLHAKEVLHALLVTSWYMIGCALLGARLVKARLLEPGGGALARRLVLIGLLVGVPCQAAAVALFYLEQPVFSYCISQLGALPLSLLYLVVLLRLANAGWLGLVGSAIRAVGRTALSNYWLQSMLACVIFHGYGLGLYGVSVATGLLVVLGVWAGELIVSSLWLAKFRLGPAEWLWRSLADWQLLPLRRTRPQPVGGAS
jgi:uncharacterized protein